MVPAGMFSTCVSRCPWCRTAGLSCPPVLTRLDRGLGHPDFSPWPVPWQGDTLVPSAGSAGTSGAGVAQRPSHCWPHGRWAGCSGHLRAVGPPHLWCLGGTGLGSPAGLPGVQGSVGQGSWGASAVPRPGSSMQLLTPAGALVWASVSLPVERELAGWSLHH